MIETSYRFDARLGYWLPAEMRETYGHQTLAFGAERVEALATYSAWRRAHVEVDVVIPQPP